MSHRSAPPARGRVRTFLAALLSLLLLGIGITTASADVIDDAEATPAQQGTWELSQQAAPTSGATVEAGEQITYTLSAAALDTRPVQGITATVDLSGVLAHASLVEPLHRELSLTGDELTWDVRNPVRINSPASVSFSVVVDSDASGVTLTSVAAPQSSGGTCTDCTITHTVPGEPSWDLSVTPNEEPGSTLLTNAAIVPSMTATNTSDVTVSDAQVVADLTGMGQHWDLGTLREGVSYDAETALLTWDVPEMEPGESVTQRFQVRLRAPARGSEVSLDFTAQGAGGECVTGCELGYHVFGFDASVTADPTAGEVTAGQQITYTWTAQNISGGELTGAHMRANLRHQAGPFLDAADLVEPLDEALEMFGSVLHWNIPDLDPGESAQISFVAQIHQDATPGDAVRMGISAGTARHGGSLVDPATLVHTVAEPTWELSHSAEPASGSAVAPGEQITYTLTAAALDLRPVTRVAASVDLSEVLSGASLVEPLPAGLSLDGDELTWTVRQPVHRNHPASVSYTVTVDDDASGATLTSVATPQRTGALCTDCTLTHTVAEPAWEVSARAAQANGVTIPNEGTVRPNGQLNYHLSAENTSGVRVSDGVVVADVSGLVAYANIEALGEGAEFDADAGVVRWSVPELGAQESASVRFRANLRFADAPNAVLPLSVSTEGAGGECVSGCELVHFATGFEASMTTDPPAGSVEAGDEIVYTWTVQNTSHAQISGATVTAQLRDVLEHAELVEPLAEELRLVSIVGPTIMRWDVPDLAAHESAEVSFSVIVRDDADAGAELATSITAGANSFGITYGEREVTHTVDQLSWEVSVRGAQANGVTIPHEGTLRPNGQVNYHVVAENTSGLTMSEGAVIADVSGLLPYADIEALTAGAEFDPENGLVRWWSPELSGGESASFSFRANLRFADAPGAVLPLSVITQGPGGECASGCELVHYVTAFEASVSADPPSGEVRAGDEVTYTWQVRNTSQAQISGAYVRAQMGGVLAHADLVEPLPDGVNFTIGTVLNWWIPDLGPGESARVSFTVVVDQDAEQGAEFGMSITAGANSFGITYGDQEVDHAVTVSVTPPAPSLPPVLAVLLGLAKWVLGFLIWLF
ncbi:hypothetical protein [Pseudactinotalea sp. Z1732]|uniref:DUF7927 domain-containing protein n=1 Tax=Micrococcales TaxID=85006 RepID=UPI003C7D1E15